MLWFDAGLCMQERFGGVEKVEVMHPIKDLKVKSKEVEKALKSIEAIDAQLADNPVHQQETQEAAQAVESLKELAVERASLQVRARTHSVALECALCSLWPSSQTVLVNR